MFYAGVRERLLPIARHDLPEAAEDLVQTTLTKLLRDPAMNRAGEIKSIIAYAYTVYRHTLADFLRDEIPRRRTVPIEAAESRPASPDCRPDHEAERSERQRILESVLGKLKAWQREILVLRYAEGKSYEEISEILRLPIGTVGSRLNDARRRAVRAASRFRVRRGAGQSARLVIGEGTER